LEETRGKSYILRDVTFVIPRDYVKLCHITGILLNGLKCIVQRACCIGHCHRADVL